MLWILIAIAVFAALIGIGIVLRRQSSNVRLIAALAVGVGLFISVSVLASLMSIAVFEYYAFSGNCTVDCEALRLAFEQDKAQYVVWMALPLMLRPACEGLPNLCVLERTYDFWMPGALVGMFVAIFGFLLVLIASRIPRRQSENFPT